MSQDKFKQFTEVSWSGKRLLEKHSLDEEGIWQIFGEDPNCDFGGSHHQPDLGIVQGKLLDVIAHAVELPQFWQWGAGGDIKSIGKEIPKVDANSSARRKELRQEAKELEKRLKAIQQELGSD